MNPERLIQKVSDLAAQHLDRPTFDHSERLVIWLAQNGASHERLAVAWLHDLLEDCPAVLLPTYLPAEVRAAVELLTRREGQPYDDYILGIRNARGIARDVKVADLLDNLYGRPEPPSAGLAARYHKALRELWNV